MKTLSTYIIEGHEVRDSKFRKALKDAGLERIHLYQDNGYLWIWSDDKKEAIDDAAIYVNKFKDQSIEDWLGDIKDKLNL